MIAVFCNYRRDFDALHTSPKGFFVHINRPRDLIGRRFTGVVILNRRYPLNGEQFAAYELLRAAQPELFSK
jgi:hypothetical protein